MSDWRLLEHEPKSGPENMAIDEALLNSCDQGQSPSCLRLYEWNEPTLSLGCFQRAYAVVQQCLRERIPVVRRLTGGRAVLHADEITYSIVCGEDEWLFGEGISGAYRIINQCLLEALREAGIDAAMHTVAAKKHGIQRISCFHFPSQYEIILEGKKLVGSAQRRFKKAFLQHGSILFGIDEELVTRLFGNESAKKMAWLGQHGNVEKSRFRSLFIERFQAKLRIRCAPSSMAEHEIVMKDRLIEERYNNPFWNVQSAKGL